MNRLRLLRLLGRGSRATLVLLAMVLPAWVKGQAQERPYFVTYSHAIWRSPAILTWNPTTQSAIPKVATHFWARMWNSSTDVKAWWTTEFYLDGQITQNQSTIFTGFRWENRFRPLDGRALD